MSKVAIIGAGNVGTAYAHALVIRGTVGEIVLIDTNHMQTCGEALDLSHGLQFTETSKVTLGCSKDVKDADLVVITAGAAQKPGETRLDLAAKNVSIIRDIARQIKKNLSKTAIVIVVANPVDILTAVLRHELKGTLTQSQVFGSGTTLDTARFHYYIGEQLGISARSVHGYVLGEHGDSEFPAWSTVRVGGAAVKLTASQKKKIEEKTRGAAYELIRMKHMTNFGIATVLLDLTECILNDQRALYPLSVNMKGTGHVSLSVPVVLGRKGTGKIFMPDLDRAEKKQFTHSQAVLKKMLKQVW